MPAHGADGDGGMLGGGGVFNSVVREVGENLLQRDEVGVQVLQFGAFVVLNLHSEAGFLEAKLILAQGSVDELRAGAFVGAAAELAAGEPGESEHILHQMAKALAFLIKGFVVFIQLFGGHELVLEHLGHEREAGERGAQLVGDGGDEVGAAALHAGIEEEQPEEDADGQHRDQAGRGKRAAHGFAACAGIGYVHVIARAQHHGQGGEVGGLLLLAEGDAGALEPGLHKGHESLGKFGGIQHDALGRGAVCGLERAHVNHVIDVVPREEGAGGALQLHGSGEVGVFHLVHAEHGQVGLHVDIGVGGLGVVIHRGGGVEGLAADGIDDGGLAFNLFAQGFLALGHHQPGRGEQEVAAHVVWHVLAGRVINRDAYGGRVAELVAFLLEQTLDFVLHAGERELEQALLLGFLVDLQQAGIERGCFVGEPGGGAQREQGEKGDDEGEFLIHDWFQRYPRPRMVSIQAEGAAPIFSRRRVRVTATVRVCAELFWLPHTRSSSSCCGITRPGWVRK